MKSYINQSVWEYVGHCADGSTMIIDGINVWTTKWISTNETIEVEDPLYHQKISMDVYVLNNGKGVEIKIAAGEYSNCVWGFYRFVDKNKNNL